jgi:hypothetical protein
MDATGYRKLHFSTDDLPAHNRIEEVCEIYGRTIIKHDIEPVGEEPFHFEADLCGVADLGVAAVVISTAPCCVRSGATLRLCGC